MKEATNIWEYKVGINAIIVKFACCKNVDWWCILQISIPGLFSNLCPKQNNKEQGVGWFPFTFSFAVIIYVWQW